MVRPFVSRLSLALALTSSMGFLGCAEETKPPESTPATPPAEAPKEPATPPAEPAKPAEPPK